MCFLALACARGSSRTPLVLLVGHPWTLMGTGARPETSSRVAAWKTTLAQSGLLQMPDHISTNTITSSTLMVRLSDTNPSMIWLWSYCSSDSLFVTMNYIMSTLFYRISHCQLAAQFLCGSNAHHQYLGHRSGKQLPAYGHGAFKFTV